MSLNAGISASRESAVKVQMGCISASIETLDKSISDLLIRLESVVRNEPSEVNEKNCKTLPGPSCNLSNDLMALNTRINEQISRIQSLISKLEL